jgi:hypothetical protein
MRGGVRPPRAEPGALSRKTAAAHRASRRSDRLATVVQTQSHARTAVEDRNLLKSESEPDLNALGLPSRFVRPESDLISVL